MELNDFVKNFASLFEDTDPERFTPDTRYKDLPEWSSLVALFVIAMVDEKYSVKIKGDDIRNSITVEDLFNTVIKLRKNV